jgi:hypothetical protein
MLVCAKDRFHDRPTLVSNAKVFLLKEIEKFFLCCAAILIGHAWAV